MAEDIAPELLRRVQSEYRESMKADRELARIREKIEAGTATGKDLDAYAVRSGELLAQALHEHVSGDILPNGRMYYNIANRLLPPVLRQNYEDVADVSDAIQTIMNEQAGIGIKAQRPELNEDRVEGLVNLAAEAEQYEDIRKELEGDVVNFSQSVATDSVKSNAEFQYQSGLSPKVERTAETSCCDWCKNLERTYDYADIRGTGNEVWKRHRACRCVVEYVAAGKRQNAHTKQVSTMNREASAERIQRAQEAEKQDREQEQAEREERIRRAEEQEKKSNKNEYSIDYDLIESKEYRDKFAEITKDQNVNERLYIKARDILEHRDGTAYEDMHLISILDGRVKGTQTKVEYYTQVPEELRPQHVYYNKSLLDAIQRNPPETLISIHNHPGSLPPSGDDFASQFRNHYRGGIIACHNGDVYYYEVGKQNFTTLLYDMTVDKYKREGYSEHMAYEMTLDQFSRDYGITWRKL